MYHNPLPSNDDYRLLLYDYENHVVFFSLNQAIAYIHHRKFYVFHIPFLSIVFHISPVAIEQLAQQLKVSICQK